MSSSTVSNSSAGSMIKQYFLDFKVLKDNSLSFWGVQIVNLLDLTAYFAMISILTLFLTENIGMSEVNSGYTVGAFSSVITLSLLFTGFITDILGIRKSLIIAMLIQGISRVGLVACGFIPDIPGREWIVVLMLLLTAPGMAMTATAYQTANKRFSSKRSRGASYNVWYLVMNLGGVIGGLSVDLIRKTLELDITYILALGVIAAGISIITSLILVRKIDEQDASEESEKEETISAWQRVKGLFTQSAFWRFITLMFSLLGVRAVFAYLYLLMPLYWVRVIEQVSGEKTDMGFLQAINPFMIFIGLILMIPFSNKFNVFKMLIFGAIISAFSLLFLVVPWELIGDDMAQSYYLMSIGMLVFLSLGEVFWSPKLYEYTATIAPKGQEGSYLGLSMMPWFLAKLMVSAMSGHLLVRWVPEGVGEKLLTGELDFWDRPEAMWFILFLWAISGPILAWLFRGWLNDKSLTESEDEQDESGDTTTEAAN